MQAPIKAPMHDWQWWKEGMQAFFVRQQRLPFNVYVALYAMWTGLAGIFDWTLAGHLFNESLSMDLAMLFNLMQFGAGGLIFIGIGWEYEHVEGLGLVLLVTSALVRGIASAALIGVNDPLAIGVVVQGIILIPACVLRFYSLWTGDKILVTTDPHVITSVEELVANGETAEELVANGEK